MHYKFNLFLKRLFFVLGFICWTTCSFAQAPCPTPSVVWRYPIGLVGRNNYTIGWPPSQVRYTWEGPGLPTGGVTYPPNVPTIVPPTSGVLTYKITATYNNLSGQPSCATSSIALTLPTFNLPSLPNVLKCGLVDAQLPEAGPLPALAAGYEYRWYGYDRQTSQLILLASGPTCSLPAPAAEGCEGIEVAIGKIGFPDEKDESERLRFSVAWFAGPSNPFAGTSFTPESTPKGVPVMPGFPNQPGYSWNWGDPTSSTNTSPPPHTYATPGIYTVTLSVPFNGDGNSRELCEISSAPCSSYQYAYAINIPDVLCESYVLEPDPVTHARRVELRQNARDGSFVFLGAGNACPEAEITWDCISTSPIQPDARLVVATSAQSMQPARVVAEGLGGPSTAELNRNPYLSGGGYMRPEAGYSYSAPLNTDVVTGSRLAKQAGRFSLASPFAWGLSLRTRPRRWLTAGNVTRHTPGGEAVEERDVLGVASAIRFGYAGRALPYITGKNTDYDGLLFESFESVMANSTTGTHEYEAGGTTPGVQGFYAHAGKRSLSLAAFSATTLLLPRPAALPASWRTQGVRVQVWVRVQQPNNPDKALPYASWAGTPLTAQAILGNVPGTSITLQPVAQSGEWTLCQGILPASAWTGTTGGVQLGWQAGFQAWLDDVRLQPAQSQATTYVYDPTTLKLLASFDDQHFGLFYQYDAEGRLIRKQVETTRGLQTVEESQYNTPRSPRPTP